MNKKYVHIGLPEDKLVEECAEVIHAIMKIKRFGLDNYHPDTPDVSNKDKVILEIKDLSYAIEQYIDSLKEKEDKNIIRQQSFEDFQYKAWLNNYQNDVSWKKVKEKYPHCDECDSRDDDSCICYAR